MSLILNGTTGISDVDGTAAAPALTGTDSNTGIFFPAADTIAFAEGGAEAVRIDSAGNVGIGTSSPAVLLNVSKDGGSGDAGQLSRITDTNTANSVGPTSLTIGMMNHFAGNPRMSIAGTTGLSFCVGDGSNFATQRKVEIDSSGNLLVGTTSGNARLTLAENSDLTEADPHFEIIGNGYSAYAWLDGTAYYIGQNSASRALRIYSSAETAGVNLAAGGTSWGTFSDERLKYDIEPITDGLTKLANVRCVSYRLKDVDAEDSQKKLGFIAQDLVGFVDEVIDITKRSGDDTDYMSVRYSELMPVLVKAIQEQQALITALTTRITALEGAA